MPSWAGREMTPSRFGGFQPAGRSPPNRESRSILWARQSCSRKLARGGLVVWVLAGVASIVARFGSSSANRQNRWRSAVSIHRSNVLCFIARLLPRKTDICWNEGTPISSQPCVNCVTPCPSLARSRRQVRDHRSACGANREAPDGHCRASAHRSRTVVRATAI